MNTRETITVMGDPGPPSDFSSPRASVRRLCALIGAEAVATWCAELLAGAVDEAAPDRPSLVWLAGAGAVARLGQRGDPGPWKDYWVRVWGARGLLYAWEPGAESAVVAALTDENWRVRELAAKVVRRRELGLAAEALVPLITDENERVRAAAVRALGPTAESEQLAALAVARHDPSRSVAAAADRALAEALTRLDLPADRP